MSFFRFLANVEQHSATPSPTSFPPPEKRRLQRTLLINSILLALFLSTIYLLNPQTVQFLNNKSMDILLGMAAAPNLTWTSSLSTLMKQA